MADIKQIKIGSTTYDIKDDTKLPLTGGTLTGPIQIVDEQEFYHTYLDHDKISMYGDADWHSTDISRGEIYLTGGPEGDVVSEVILSPEGLKFNPEIESIATISGLVNATENDQAVPLGQVKDLINSTLASEVTFKGATSSLPSNPTNGDMYKVSAAISKASNMDAAAKVGDTIIYNKNDSKWYVIPSGDDIEDTWRTIKVNGTQLLGGGTTTSAVNFKSGNGISVSGSGADITIAGSVVSTTSDGLAPKRDGSTTKFLRADGTWAVPPDTNTTYTFNGAVSTIKDSNLTASRVLVSNSSGKVAASSAVTTTELGYLDGVTSKIQTQLNNKLSTSGGNVNGVINIDTSDEGEGETPGLGIYSDWTNGSATLSSETLIFENNESGSISTFSNGHVKLTGGYSSIVLDGWGETGTRATLKAGEPAYDEEDEDEGTYGLFFNTEDGDGLATVSGLRYAKFSTEAVPLGQMNAKNFIKTTNNLYQQFWRGTQAQYNAISNKNTNTWYLITDADA